MSEGQLEKENQSYFILNLFCGISERLRLISPLTLLKPHVPHSDVPKTPEEKKKNYEEATITEKYTLSTFLFVFALWLVFFLFDARLFRLLRQQVHHMWVMIPLARALVLLTLDRPIDHSVALLLLR